MNARGPGDEQLTLDVAILDGPPAAPALIVSSGLHGIEGFLGSAVQLQLLADWQSSGRRPTGVRVVLLHALNPYGFAWRRRFNEQNVDLNRNFLLPDQAYEGCAAAYRLVDPVLNPPSPPPRVDLFALQALWAVLRYGRSTLAAAVPVGQYEFEKGLFFGGHGPSHLMHVMQQHLSAWVSQAPTVFHLDYHTGLGPWAQFQILLDAQVTDSKLEWLRSVFGNHLVVPYDASKATYLPLGGFGAWCVAQLADRDYSFVCAEIGTYRPVKVIGGLRAENRAHHWAAVDDPVQARTKQRLQELFCPGSSQWRHEALQQGGRLIDQALAALGDNHEGHE